MKITLYHGSLNKIEAFDDAAWGIYLTPSVGIANGYIVAQADDAIGEYGHIYMVEVDDAEIILTDDIDQIEKKEGVLFCENDGYYRIDYPSKYNFQLLPNEIVWKMLQLGHMADLGQAPGAPL